MPPQPPAGCAGPGVTGVAFVPRDGMMWAGPCQEATHAQGRTGMSQPAGFNLPLSLPRRFICDLLHFAQQIPSVPVQRRMHLGPVAAARAAAEPRPSWAAVFIKALLSCFASVATCLCSLKPCCLCSENQRTIVPTTQTQNTNSTGGGDGIETSGKAGGRGRCRDGRLDLRVSSQIASSM